MERAREDTPRHVLEQRQVFSRSILWELQRRYYAARGVDAWRRDYVPDYITSNPPFAAAYAEIVFAVLQDRNRLAAGDEAARQPLHICELGAGAGRFAFHFLRRLAELCAQEGVPLESFRYVLTDMSAANLRFWRAHARLQPFFASGVLDTAELDIHRAGEIALQGSGRTIGAASLRGPLVVIANYVFDSVPQDLFYLDGAACRECLLSLTTAEEPDTLDAAGLLASLQCSYDYRTLDEPPYEEPWLRQLLDGYRQQLKGTHLLFPAATLRCLRRLKALSEEGLVLLCADKGDHRLAALEARPPPDLAVDATCVSLEVNFHAIQAFCEQEGGLAWFPRVPHEALKLGCCVMSGRAERYERTRRAYRRCVEESDPVDFFHMIFHAIDSMDGMSAEEILAYVRFSRYDAIQLERFLPRLVALAPELDADARAALVSALELAWESYFPLGEHDELANGIALLLYEMDEYGRALEFFARSIEICGEDSATLCNMAACYRMLGRHELAEPLLRKALEHDPGNAQAAALLAECAAGGQ